MLMRMKTVSTAATAFALTALFTHTHAATHNLNLAGVTANSTTFETVINGMALTYWRLNLEGLNDQNSFLASPGDKITATISFDKSIALTPATDTNKLSIALRGLGSGSTPSNTVGTMTLSNNGVVVVTWSGNCFSGTITACAALPQDMSIVFDKIESSFDLASISNPYTVTSVGLEYFRMTAAVPEPESYALMLGGLAGVGAAIRRRRSAAKTAID